MRSQALLITALNAIYATQVVADGYRICHGAQCGDCPVAPIDTGLGYPECTIYNSADVFTGKFEKNKLGEWDVWFDLPQQNVADGCYWIIRSPASQGIDNCGTPLYVGQNEACRNIQLKETFMLQFCCGQGDCCNSGVPNQAGCSATKREMMMRNPFELRNGDSSRKAYARSGGGGSLILHDKDGNAIKPMAQGSPINAKSSIASPAFSYRIESTQDASNKLESRGRCAADSWVDDGEEYLTTSDNTQIVSDVVPGGTTYHVQKSRSSSWSTTRESSLSFADIIGMGISFSVTETKEISTSETYDFPVPKGQKGYVAFTPYVRCKKGSGKCDGNGVSGTVCVPFAGANGGPAGEYNLVQVG